MRKLSLLCLLLSCVAGCQWTLKNQGQTWVEFGTRIEFGSSATKTIGDETATIKVDAKPAVDHFVKLKDAGAFDDEKDIGDNDTSGG